MDPLTPRAPLAFGLLSAVAWTAGLSALVSVTYGYGRDSALVELAGFAGLLSPAFGMMGLFASAAPLARYHRLGADPQRNDERFRLLLVAALGITLSLPSVLGLLGLLLLSMI